MTNPPYTRFDYSSYGQWMELFRQLGHPVYRLDLLRFFSSTASGLGRARLVVYQPRNRNTLTLGEFSIPLAVCCV